MEIIRQGRKVVEQVFKPKKNEKVLIITDKEEYGLSAVVAEVFKELEVQVTLWIIPQGFRPFRKMNSTLSSLVSESDLILYLLDRRFDEKAFRTELVKTAIKSGRICMLTGIQKENKEQLILDYTELKERNNKLKSLLEKADKIEINCPNGTKLGFSIKDRKIRSIHGLIDRKGCFGSLPAGQITIAPVEESFNGIVFTHLIEEDFFENPIALEFRNGELIKFNGKDKRVKKFSKELDLAAKNPGDAAKRIASFTIGTNDACKKSKNLLEASKAAGSIQFSIGDSMNLGSSKSSIRMDFVLHDATVKIDNKTIIKEGKLIEGPKVNKIKEFFSRKMPKLPEPLKEKSSPVKKFTNLLPNSLKKVKEMLPKLPKRPKQNV